ncbi:MAG: type II toxin-antitoxin system HicB family antitoxin [Candidatus Acidiferrum sp.]
MKYCLAAVITKEDDWYVARCPQLNVTSQGKDVESARTNLREAVELYLKTWGARHGRPEGARRAFSRANKSRK